MVHGSFLYKVFTVVSGMVFVLFLVALVYEFPSLLWTVWRLLKL
jgi:hypothetical protein